MKIDVPASQIDIAATLLYQLGIDHSEFIFSKNMLNPASPHFGYFTEPSFFGMVTDTNQLVYNLDGEKVMLDEGSEKDAICCLERHSCRNCMMILTNDNPL